MSAKHFAITLAISLAALGGAAAQSAAPQPTVPEYTVFVDPPTGFVFVRMPAGWKFVGQVDQAALQRLPDSVVTWLLPHDDERHLAVRDGQPLR